MKNDLEVNDYTDPICPFCTDRYQKEKQVKPIPTGRILEKLDAYFAKNDFDGALRHLQCWMEEAKLGHDGRGELLLYNEMMGIYRKTGKEAEAFRAAGAALERLDALRLRDSITAGTVLLNAATVNKAFGKAETAIRLYSEAEALYKKYLQPNDARFGGLYNNMGLALNDLGRFSEARAVFQKALDVMFSVPHGEGEAAITCLNLADTAEAEKGGEKAEKEIADLIDRARTLLHTPDLPHDGNYAYICEKCAPTFGYYGYFADAEELSKRAEEIYERS